MQTNDYYEKYPTESQLEKRGQQIKEYKEKSTWHLKHFTVHDPTCVVKMDEMPFAGELESRCVAFLVLSKDDRPEKDWVLIVKGRMHSDLHTQKLYQIDSILRALQ